MIAAAARALATGDPLGALDRVALRDDAPALALRGIAMAQLGELDRASELLRRARRAFGPREARARARCVVAEAEVALARREFRDLPRALTMAADILEQHGDHANARLARLLDARRCLLLGRVDDAAAALAMIDRADASPALSAALELSRAEVALRSLQTDHARTALDRAHAAALEAGIPALLAEIVDARSAWSRPVGRVCDRDGARALHLDDYKSLLDSGAVVIDGCRRGVRAGATWRPLARRPVLFALVQALAEAWPHDVDRRTLIARAFRTHRPDESHRARLRVEIGRLRRVLRGVATLRATADGFALEVSAHRHVVLLTPPVAGPGASLIALLSDGAAWSTSSLALAVGASQRTVQRTLVELEAGGQARSIRRARARRWLAPPLLGFTTILLLPTSLPGE